MWGKAFAIAYALVGIPIFMWYIVKLGGLFRVIAIKIVAAAINCIWWVSTLWFQLEDIFQLIVTPKGIEKVLIQLKDTPTKVYAIGAEL